MPDDVAFLLELIRSLQSQVKDTASINQVQDVKETLNIVIRRIDAIETRVMQRIDELAKADLEMRKEEERNTRQQVSRLVGVQTTVLTGAILAVIGAIVEYLIRR